MVKLGIVAIVAGLAFVSTAQAGGLERGHADTDILYEAGHYVFKAGGYYTMPKRKYKTIAGNPGTDGNFMNSYFVPNMAAKIDVTQDMRCAGTYTQSFGADASYGKQSIAAGLGTSGKGTASVKFLTNEFGLTCGYKVKAGSGNLWFLGGGYLQDISYTEKTFIGGPSVANNLTVLDLKQNYKLGYRLGLAYEIADIAFRVQAMYRSQVKHNLTGTFTAPTALSAVIKSNPNATGRATLPQSFQIEAQTGIAPGWLLFGSIKWTDWSAFDVLHYTSGLGLPENQKEFFYKDGWTYNLGVGHKFNDKISASLALTYDKGVSTTENVNKDTFTVSSGLQLNLTENAKLSLGGAISHLQGGSVAKASTCTTPPNPISNPTCGDGPGGNFAYSLGDDWAYTIGGGLQIKF